MEQKVAKCPRRWTNKNVATTNWSVTNKKSVTAHQSNSGPMYPVHHWPQLASEAQKILSKKSSNGSNMQTLQWGWIKRRCNPSLEWVQSTYKAKGQSPRYQHSSSNPWAPLQVASKPAGQVPSGANHWSVAWRPRGRINCKIRQWVMQGQSRLDSLLAGYLAVTLVCVCITEGETTLGR